MLDILLSQPFLLLFLLVGLGMALGRITVAGVNLGTSVVLFLALAAGHFGYVVPEGVGILGLLLFAYCVGVGAGNRFFSSLKREGLTLIKLSIVVVGAGCGVTLLLAHLLNLPPDMAGGLFAGAMTSTPALAAATEALDDAGRSNLVVGYGVAYPFGVIGVVLFVQILPRLLKADLQQLAREEGDPGRGDDHVETALVEVRNSNLFGKPIAESGINAFNACQISRVLREGQLVPLQYEDAFEEGQKLYLVGRRREMDIAVDYLGRRVRQQVVTDADNERQLLLVTSKNITGRTLRQVAPLREHGVIVTRIHRLGYEFVPSADTAIEHTDQLTVVGPAEKLGAFAGFVGHRPNQVGETDLISLSIGLALGIFAGLVPLALPGTEAVTLGLAGGPLLVGLILGHFGKVGRIVGFIPRPTRLLLQEFGLSLFLADAGVRGGATLVETVQQYGIQLVGAGLCIALIPLLIGFLAARRWLKLTLLQTLGGACGAMTSTPALGVITGKTDSPVPVISYATAYPLALILMTILAKFIVTAFGAS